MAQTKTRSSSGRSKPRKSKTGGTGSQAKAKSAQRSRSTASRGRARRNGSGNGAGKASSARKAVESTAKQAGGAVEDAGQTVGQAAKRAKTPLLAGGAALAGAAGGLALGARAARKSKLPRPKLKIRTQDVARAARDVGQFGMDVGQLATELRTNREAANGSKHRSPVEVVLDGLTHRSGRSDS